MAFLLAFTLLAIDARVVQQDGEEAFPVLSALLPAGQALQVRAPPQLPVQVSGAPGIFQVRPEVESPQLQLCSLHGSVAF